MLARRRRLALIAILAGSALVRLHHVDEPMADSLLAKQAYVANRARSIAEPPLNPLRSSLDFLDANGERTSFTDEIPLYHTLLAIGYRAFGERDRVGHALSLAGTLLALAAFFDLARRQCGDRAAVVATIVFSAAPVFVFYGRAVLPEPWMLAMMLGAAASYRIYLDEGKPRWLAAASMAALGAGLFKYFGLIVFVVLAEMAWRRRGTWRAVFAPSFLVMLAAATVPMAAWMGLVFFRTANPVQTGWVDGRVMPYFAFEDPAVLFSRGFYGVFFGRFLARDFGPVAAALLVVGVIAAIRSRREGPTPGMLRGWTIMALIYYVLLAPKFRDHDYYELMMLPAAALWAARGLEALVGGAFLRGAGLALPSSRVSSGRARPHGGGGGRPALAGTAAILALAVVVQSPWVAGGLFRQDRGKLALADRLRALSSPESRVVAMGPGIEFPTVIHYSGREGWPVHSPNLPEDWRARLDLYRSRRADVLAVYFEPKATAAQRASYAPLLRSLPVIERRGGLPNRSGGPCEFVILDLRQPRTADRDEGTIRR